MRALGKVFTLSVATLEVLVHLTCLDYDTHKHDADALTETGDFEGHVAGDTH